MGIQERRQILLFTPVVPESIYVTTETALLEIISLLRNSISSSVLAYIWKDCWTVPFDMLGTVKQIDKHPPNPTRHYNFRHQVTVTGGSVFRDVCLLPHYMSSHNTKDVHRGHVGIDWC